MTTGDAMDWTPGECLRQSALEADAKDVTACVVIMLDRGPDGNHYLTYFRNSGLRCSEVVALLEIKKQEIIQELTGG